MTAADWLAEDTRLGRAGLTVRSLRETSTFYRDVVGLVEHEQTGTRTTLGSPDWPLLELLDDPGAPERTATQAGLYHLAFRLPSRAALGAALERIEGQWRLEGASDHGVSEALYLRDPENNGLEIYRDRPREEWPRDENGDVTMITAPLDLNELRTASNQAETVPVDTVLGHVHLEVTDLVAAREFYVETLGMDVTAEYGGNSLFLAADEYHHHVALNTWNGRSAPATNGGQGLAWYEIVVPDATELRRVVNRFLESGTDVRGDGGELTVVDPAGISLRTRPAVGVASHGDASAGREG